MLLQAFYGIRSERQLMERLEFGLLFRWLSLLAWLIRRETIRPSPKPRPAVGRRSCRAQSLASRRWNARCPAITFRFAVR